MDCSAFSTKYACEDKAMESRKVICSICTNKCVVNAQVENGRLLGVKPVGDPQFKGCPQLCLRGVCGADFEYRPDRILSPLRRVGARGEGRFEEISWDEAMDEIARRLLALRETYGASATAFFCGYPKWYRPMLRRLAVSYGSPNYGTESSSCHRATVLAEMCNTGFHGAADYANAKLLLAYARARFPKPAKDAHKAGMKILVIDPRSSRDIREFADLHLRLRPGTDAALAAGIANALIARGAVDEDYITNYVHGYEQYKAYVSAFTPEETERITGVPAALVTEAAALIADNLPFTMLDGFTGVIHHRNGVQDFRCWSALNAITGCYGRCGGQQAVGVLQCNGHEPYCYRELEFSHPKDLGTEHLIGGRRFPVWAAKLDECQAMDFPNAVRRGELKAIYAHGMNARMFPDSAAIFDMLKKLDFFVDCDIWMSDTAKYADIVLPVCTSYERDQISLFMQNSKLYYSRKAVEPYALARSDEDIMVELAQRMDLDDALLKSGKEACWRWQLEGTGITLEELKTLGKPYALPKPPRPKPLEQGFATPTGKFELFSEVIAALQPELDPLPTYADPLAGQDTKTYPLILMAGVRTDRYAHAVHSRIHTVPALRKRRPDAAVDLNPDDAAALGISKGERVSLETAFGAIEVSADLDDDLLPGTVNMFHGYSEADVNTLIPGDYLDPISGFPGYKAIACRVVKR